MTEQRVLEGPDTAADFESEDRAARVLLRGLNRPEPLRFWTDLVLTSALGWTAFTFAVTLDFFSTRMILATAVAVLALYRGLCFVHEISHLNPRALPGFEWAWNLLLGYPMLMPSFIYVGVHQSHHSLSSYGTADDPEYLPFSRTSRLTIIFALQAFLIPVILLVRFLVLTPLTLSFPRLTRWLIVHASSLSMNPKYRRRLEPKLVYTVEMQSAFLLLLWTLIIAAMAAGLMPWRVFLVWILVSAVASFINTLRTLGAHDYESEGEPLDRFGQLQDSIDTPGAAWTELWAPVGLRYHALHHYFPGIPYHNLPEAYRRLVKNPGSHAAYRQTLSPGLWHSLSALYKRGARR